MSREIVLTLVDDLDGSENQVRTVVFGHQGRDYEIDLSVENAERLDAFLLPFIEAGRRVNGVRAKVPGQKGPRPTVRPNGLTNAEHIAKTRRIREWAATEGIILANIGRVPVALIKLFDKPENKRTKTDEKILAKWRKSHGPAVVAVPEDETVDA